jgi:capsular polysaccharide biosynthesis protein
LVGSFLARARHAVGPARRRISRSPYIPCRLEQSVEQWIASFERDRFDELPRSLWTIGRQWYEPVRAGSLIIRTPPRSLQRDIHPELLAGRIGVSPPVFLAKLSNCRVVGARGAVVSADNALFAELSFEFPLTRAQRQHSIFKGSVLGPPLRRSEWFGLVTSPGCTSYFHWLFDGLPRAGLLCRFRHSLDYLLLPRELQPFHRTSLDRLGFGERMLYPLDWDTHLELENLIVPSLPGQSLQVPKWVCDWLRATFAVAPSRRSRRVYVSRRDASRRFLANEDEIVAVLSEFGVEPIAPSELDWAEQIALFGECELVVGPHGAGMANLVFCPRDVRVVELFSPDYVNGCYWGVTDLLGGSYWYLVGTRTAGFEGREMAGDIEIDPAQLAETVRSALREN